MATNGVFSHTEAQAEIWTVPSEVASGVALVGGATGAQPGVALTASGAHTKSATVGPYTISGIPDGGVGLDALQVSTATDGTWEFLVTGGLTTTAQNTLVYAVVSGGLVTSLTLTASTNAKFGKVNWPKGYNKVAGRLPVKIGVFL